MSLWSNRKPALGQRLTSKKWATFMRSKPEPAIWSCDTGQWISRYESCQLNIWMSNIKDICCNPRLHDLVLARWPPCCVMLSSLCDVVIGCTHPWYMPLAILPWEKSCMGFCISMHACDPVPIVMGLLLAALPAPGAVLKFVDYSLELSYIIS